MEEKRRILSRGRERTEDNKRENIYLEKVNKYDDAMKKSVIYILT